MITSWSLKHNKDQCQPKIENSGSNHASNQNKIYKSQILLQIKGNKEY